MREELISFKLKTSRFAIVMIILAGGSLLLLLSMAKIQPAFKLIILLITTSVISLAYFKSLQNKISGCDLLLQLKEAVIWKGRQSYLAKIVAFRRIGYLAAVITFQISDHRETTILFFDSIEQLGYKHLMRHIKWQSQASNNN